MRYESELLYVISIGHPEARARAAVKVQSRDEAIEKQGYQIDPWMALALGFGIGTRAMHHYINNA